MNEPEDRGEERDRGMEIERSAAAFEPITIDPALCTGCNGCVDVCQVDVFLPEVRPLEPPIVCFPAECWHCGDCVGACPEDGAIRLNVMPKNRVAWRRKDTGEDFELV